MTGVQTCALPIYWESFLPSETSQINFETYRARDYYRLLLVKKYQSPHTGPERWERDISIDTVNWTDVFETVSKTCRENRLKEFQFKFIHGSSLQRKNFSDMG